MKIIGISGSKGKTTVSYLLHLYLDKLNISNLIYSSIDYEIALPNNDRLIEIIEDARKKDIEYLILEVNEEIIEKIDISVFDYKVLTNVSVLTDIEEFSKYKQNLLSFFDNNSKNILCYSPIVGKNEFLDFTKKLQEKVLFGSSYEIDKYGLDKEVFSSLIYNNNEPIDGLNGIKFYIISRGKKTLIESNMMFGFNAHNINCLYTIVNEIELYDEAVFLNLLKCVTIPGRCEVIDIHKRKIIITLSVIPVLECLNKYKEGSNINDVMLVIGSIGTGHNAWEEEYNTEVQDEKLSKGRKYAMNYAAIYSNYIYLTSSDPASTDPLQIANEMERHLIEKGYYKSIIEVDRYKAIKKALLQSMGKDVIVISGRGNRRKYVKENIEYLFSDYELVQKAIYEIGWK